MAESTEETRIELRELLALSADLVRATQQNTRHLEIQTQQIGELTESITALRLESEAQGQRMAQGFERMEQGFERMEQGFERMERGLDRLEEVVREQGQQMHQGLDRLEKVVQDQGSQMLTIVQQLVQVVDHMVADRDR